MSSQIKAISSKSPLLPRLQERTVAIEDPVTNKYDCHFIHQKVTIAFYYNHGLLSLVQVDEQTPVCLDVAQTGQLQAAIQGVTKLSMMAAKG